MPMSLIRFTRRFAIGLTSLFALSAAAVAPAAAQTTVDAGASSGVISTTQPSVTVPVTITRTSNTPVLGFSVDFTLSPELTLTSGATSITEGTFLLAGGGTTSFQIIDHGGGLYTADGVTLGQPCGSPATSGTLFDLALSSIAASGTGTVTITSVTLRDCGNGSLASSIGTTAAVTIDNTLPTVAVTAPNGAELWVVGSTRSIDWTASDNEAIASDGIDLEYSTDNGGAWTSIATNLANSGTYAWLVPDDASTTALVRATARDVNGNSAQDASDATFTIGYFVITVTQAANGVIAPPGPVDVAYDGSQAFTITPDPGYHTADVVVDGGSQGALDGYTFSNVVGDHTLTAAFAANELSIDDVTVSEGDGTATFTVSLNAPVPAGQTVSVDYATADGSALAPGDYTSIPTTTLTFIAGESSKPVVVTLTDDAIAESTEGFTVELSNPSGALVADGSGTGTINDDEPTPTVALSVDKPTLLEDGTDSPATFTATLSGASDLAITVDLAFSGTATLTDDYTRSGAQIVIPALSLSGSVTVDAVQDALDEADETIVADVDAVSAGATEDGTQQATVTIQDDDAAPELSIDDVTLAEGDAGTTDFIFTVSLSAASGQTVTVDYQTTDGTAVAPDDYAALTSTPLTFLPGETSKPVTVTVNGDAVSEPDETFTVDLSNPSNATLLDGQGTGTITNDDAAPTLSIDDVALAEGNAGTTDFTFTVSLSAASSQNVTLNYQTTDGTAIAPGDYTAVTITMLTFLPGEVSKPVTITVQGDGTSEADETFTVNLSNAVNATIGTADGTGTILNDDALGDLAAAQQTTGNDTDGTTKITLTFTAPPGAAAIEVYRAGYGGYPEYDDNGGAVPPAPGAYPPSAPWTLTGVTANGAADETATRDYFYYVVYTQNGGGVWSPPSNVTTGTLNYHLGDVSNGTTPGQGDNLVNPEDISLLGSNYGIVLGPLDPAGYLDVGPTGDLSVSALPTTDHVIDFEDLVMFAINYGLVGAPQTGVKPMRATAAADAIVLHAPDRTSVGGTIDVALTASGTGLVHALSVALGWDPAVVEPVGYSTGPMLEEQGGLLLSARAGVLDAALLGRERDGLAGEGTLATMTFRVLAEGDPKFAIASVTARDGANRAVPVAASTGLVPRPVPLTTSLSGAVPNPVRGSTAIVFGLAQGGPGEVSLYAVDGRRVRTLARGFLEAGEYRLDWDGRDDDGQTLAPGAYFVRLVAPGVQLTRKLTFLR